MTHWWLYSPKRRSLSTKRWLPTASQVAHKCRSLERSALKDQRLAIGPAPIPGIGGICRARFTVPKYLGSMVGFETKPTIVSTP
jgi:hypothetical protein